MSEQSQVIAMSVGPGIGTQFNDSDEREQTAVLISYVRWAGVLLGIAQAFLTTSPAPVWGWRGVFAASMVMAAYNLPAAFVRSLPDRWVNATLLLCLVGDFLVCTAWTLLTSNDVYSTSYAVFGLVSIEAAVLYRWRGALMFTGAFAVAYGFFYGVRWHYFGFPPLLSSVVYRSGLIVMTALFIGGIARQSERRRVALRESEQQAKRASRVDQLTQVGNRRAWDEELPRAIAVARRNRSPVVIGILDLDSLKEYNDDWGHAMGDRLLQAFTSSWRGALREVDFIARYGGDEFAVILPGSDLDSGRQVLDRLRSATSERQTVSVGLAQWDGTETPEELVARADAALYETKRAGRGRVAAASTSSLSVL
jgi:diguanylate cyclase (GGDEF)-like protein